MWDSRVLDRVGVGTRFTHLALVRGRAQEAARLVNKLWSYTAYPGLASKLDQIIADHPLDDEMLELVTQSLLSASSTSNNTPERWGLSAFLLHSGQERYLEGVVSVALSFLDPFRPKTGLALRVCDVIDSYGRTQSATTLATRLRAIIAVFPPK